MSFIDSNLGLNYGWALGESGWNDDMDDNLKRIGTLLGLSVKDRSLSTPPGTLTDGDRYLVSSGSSGDWAGHDSDVALWDDNLSSWVFYTPKVGWLCYVENEDKLCVYKNTGWSSGISI